MILNAGSELVYFARPGPVPGPFKLVTVLWRLGPDGQA